MAHIFNGSYSRRAFSTKCVCPKFLSHDRGFHIAEIRLAIGQLHLVLNMPLNRRIHIASPLLTILKILFPLYELLKKYMKNPREISPSQTHASGTLFLSRSLIPYSKLQLWFLHFCAIHAYPLTAFNIRKKFDYALFFFIGPSREFVNNRIT